MAQAQPQDQPAPPILLFGYDSSPFTQKVRLALHLKRLPYTLILVPSMLPRPLLTSAFAVSYRKIPLLAIGRDLYADTSLILEALESRFPSPEHPSLYPADAAGRSNRSLIRGFASYWTDRPFFRVTTGLIPANVWRTSFGVDRAGLIGHVLDAEKLEAKLPANLSGLDLHLSLFEAHFAEAEGLGQGGEEWMFGTGVPGLGDVSLYYQLDWGYDIARGKGIEDLTGGGTVDTDGEGATVVFNEGRYPALWAWYERMKGYLASLPSLETKIARSDEAAAMDAIKRLKQSPKLGAKCMVKTPAGPHMELDARTGLTVGKGLKVSIAPDDTGRGDPTIGTLVGLSPEEVVIEPVQLNGKEAVVDVAVHFPRLGFMIKPLREAKL